MKNNYSTQEQIQINEIQFLLKQGSISKEDAYIRLKNIVVNETETQELFKKIIDENREDEFAKIERKTEESSSTQIAFGLILAVSLFSAMFAENFLTKLANVFLCGLIGYYFFKERTIIGIVIGIVFSSTFPFAYDFYFKGRTHFIRIEIIFPLIISAIPTYLVVLYLKSTLYGNEDE